MEADYNFINKLLIGVRVMKSIEQRKAVPETFDRDFNC